MKRGRLYGSRIYLAGAMDRVADNGAEWRRELTPFLASLGIIVINPCDKPTNVGLESMDDKKYRQKLKNDKNWDEFSVIMRKVRTVDLHMVDISNAIICNVDLEVHATGTYEEIFWANRLKRCVMIRCVQGIDHLPDWLWGCFPKEHIFNTWDEIKSYLLTVNECDPDIDLDRWMFLDYDRLTVEGQANYLKNKYGIDVP